MCREIPLNKESYQSESRTSTCGEGVAMIQKTQRKAITPWQKGSKFFIERTTVTSSCIVTSLWASHPDQGVEGSQMLILNICLFDAVNQVCCIR